MTKPTTIRTSAAAFKGAPKWAKYAAKDADGWGTWYDHKPAPFDAIGSWIGIKSVYQWKYTAAMKIAGHWRDSLRRRPTKKRTATKKGK